MPVPEPVHNTIIKFLFLKEWKLFKIMHIAQVSIPKDYGYIIICKDGTLFWAFETKETNCRHFGCLWHQLLPTIHIQIKTNLTKMNESANGTEAHELIQRIALSDSTCPNVHCMSIPTST